MSREHQLQRMSAQYPRRIQPFIPAQHILRGRINSPPAPVSILRSKYARRTREPPLARISLRHLRHYRRHRRKPRMRHLQLLKNMMSQIRRIRPPRKLLDNVSQQVVFRVPIFRRSPAEIPADDRETSSPALLSNMSCPSPYRSSPTHSPVVPKYASADDESSFLSSLQAPPGNTY